MNAVLYYVFDPLCGWCYGASATISRLSSNPGVQLKLAPSGLFSGEGARPMDDEFALHAWSNDQRIGRLTGQPFSDRYRSEVLADRQQMLDSGPATVALTAVAQTAPERELEALVAIQRARYVQGFDVTLLDTLRGVLRTLGLEQAAALLDKPDGALLEATRRRIAHAQSLLAEFGARGVPTLIRDQGGDRQLLDASSMVANPQAFMDQFAAA
jgi:putative protein-disulfide isomerase